VKGRTETYSGGERGSVVEGGAEIEAWTTMEGRKRSHGIGSRW